MTGSTGVSQAGRQPRNAVHSYERLEHRLTLLSWLHDRLGYENTKRLLDHIRPAKRDSTRTAAATSAEA